MKTFSASRNFLLPILAICTTAVLSFAQDNQKFTPKHRGVPVLLIERVEQLVNLDHGDALGKNRADFYAMVTINGVQHKSEICSDDDARPYWEFPMDMGARYSNVRVRMMEEDGGLEGKDDHVDISPIHHQKDIKFRYDRHTGRVTGAVRGKLGQQFVIQGKGDDDGGRMTFKVFKG